MPHRFETKPRAGAVIIGPAWHSSGSFEVFKSQARTLSVLGFETYFLAVHHYWMNRDSYSKFRKDYEEGSRGMPATERGIVTYPVWPFFAERRFDRADPAETEAFARTKPASLMRIPDSLPEFIRSKDEFVVICNHYFTIPIVERLQRALGHPFRFAVETHDIQSNHFRPRVKAMPDALYKANLDCELGFLRKADHLVHISTLDQSFFAEALPDQAHTLVFPSLPERRRETRPPATPSATTFLIVASWNDANADSIDWFLREVWSRYEGSGCLKIIGNIDVFLATRHPETYRRWTHLFVGRVADVAEWYEAAAVVLIPVTSGEGLSIKFAEAMAFGKRVLFTPRAIRGLPGAYADRLRDGLCETADAMLRKMAAVSFSGEPVTDSASLSIYRDLFSQDRHTTAYAKITRAVLNKAKVPGKAPDKSTVRIKAMIPNMPASRM